MDSRAVAKEINREIWPLLRREGFTKFSSRTAWRHTPEQIHVVNYKSFNSYLAEGVGCTTFSFALNLGIFFRAIPFHYPVRKGPDPSMKPQVYSERVRSAVPNSTGIARHRRGSPIAPRHSGSNPPEFLCQADTSADCALQLLQRWRSHRLTAGLAPNLASLEIVIGQ